MGALGCAERNKQDGNNTRMRPTHEKSRLCGCVSMMFCFHALQCLCLFSTNQRVCSRFFGFGFERLDFVTCPFVDRCACFVLHCRNVGSSRRRVEQATLCGLCFAISPQPSCEQRPHISEIYQLIGRVAKARQQLRTAVFGCLESSK